MSGGGRTAIVTGAAGFVGRALVGRLVRDGWTVQSWVRPGSGQRVPALEGVTIIDVADPLHPPQPDGPVDVVVNLAAAGAQSGGRAASQQLIDTNARFPAALLDAVAGASPTRFIQIASCVELANTDSRAPLPDDHPLDPQTDYGRTKAEGTAAVVARGARLGIPVIVLRLFGCYGPGEGPGRLIPFLRAQLQAGEAADLTPGTQVRDFTWVDDVADAIAAAMTATGIEAGRPYNVCSGQPVVIRDLARMVAEACGRPDLLRIGAIAGRPGEAAWQVGDPGAFQAVTGWAPEVSLTEGVRRLCMGAQA